MPDAKYPHQVKICLTEAAYQKLTKELYGRSIVGDLSPTISDVVLLYFVKKVQDQDVHPVWLDVDDLKKQNLIPDRRKVTTIVPCKECHEHPCTC